ncbi:MAG: UDP-N-acetylmuramoyl-L-alanyl-D-glutamate--2,6-diaminopimelate ligase [Silanimonas sp.]
MSALRLPDLLAGIVAVPTALDVGVMRLVADSRRVRSGDVFVALAGASTHGLRHAVDVLAKGAAAILHDGDLPADLRLDDAVAARAIAVPGLRAHLGALADRVAASPSATLRVVGVTGTNGKTSTVQLIAQALEHLGLPAGTIGTLGAGRVGRIVEGERTTPDVLSVHALLAQLRDDGARAVAMEVSSHALDQGRVDGVRFEVAVFSNLTRDHLDYHGTMDAYGEAKARLFAWPTLRGAVINIDDAFGRTLAARLPERLRWTVSAAGDTTARLRADGLALTADGLRFELVEGAQRAAITSSLLGRFNADNLLAVAGALRAMGFDFETVAGVLPSLEPVHGRMTRLGGGTKPLVVVDYAHTPDALQQALVSLRGHVHGALICVFGCGGERDRGKRPQMATIAESLADRVIVTDDNPRSEDGDAIVADILKGFREPARHAVLRDRRAAIRSAVAAARAGDVVLLAGKGHEPYQEIGGVKYAFDDVDEAGAALEACA